MAYRNGNYSAFYVAEPFNEGNLGANATKDFVYYNLLRAWKGDDSSFPFVDAHEKNYNVRTVIDIKFSTSSMSRGTRRFPHGAYSGPVDRGASLPGPHRAENEPPTQGDNQLVSTSVLRDGSDWEKTLKPRIRERLRNSKNLILFLSSITKNSRALREEVDYGINAMELPVIVVYPDFSEKSDIIGCESKTVRKQIKDLWGKVPKFRDSMADVPTMHVPNRKSLIKEALQDDDFKVQTKRKAGVFFYLC